jgi:hypothetical protein
MILIGVVGRKMSGKDTLADYLVKRYHFQKRALATPLKQACQILFLLTDGQMEDHILKETMDDRWGMSPRIIFQKMGTDIIRKTLGDDFWIRHMDEWLRVEQPLRLIIPDIRFPNEAEWIRRQGGILIGIQNHSIMHDPHISETGVDNIEVDISIVNDRTLGLDVFYNNIETILSHVLSTGSQPGT